MDTNTNANFVVALYNINHKNIDPSLAQLTDDEVAGLTQTAQAKKKTKKNNVFVQLLTMLTRR